MIKADGRTEGLDELTTELKATTLRDAKLAVMEGLLMMEQAIKRKLTGRRHGRKYSVPRSAFRAKKETLLLDGRVLTKFESPPKTHTAAAEDEAPGVLTGRLRNSVSTRGPVTNGDEVSGEYGTNVEYARIHEYGGIIEQGDVTIKMPARPYIRPAEDETFPKILAKWRKRFGG